MLKTLQDVMPSWPGVDAGLRDQVRRAMTSVVLNLAEGCGKLSPRDRRRFFAIARGSLLEVSGGIDVAWALGGLTGEQARGYHESLLIIAKQLSSLIRSQG
jgi:four helix bundle protein